VQVDDDAKAGGAERGDVVPQVFDVRHAHGEIAITRGDEAEEDEERLAAAGSGAVGS